MINTEINTDEQRAGVDNHHFAFTGAVAGLLLLAVTGCSSPVHETSVPPRTEECSVRVYVQAASAQAQGAELYSAPTSDAEVVGRLPADTVATIIRADQQVGEYLHVVDVELVEDEPATRAPFPRSGWLRIDNAYVDVQPEMEIPPMAPTWPQLYESPGPDRRPRHQIGDDPSAAQLRGCMGTWVDVQLTDRKQVHRGWLEQADYCGNPVTTCNY